MLKIGHKYDLTIVSLVLHLPKPVAKAEPAGKDDSVDGMMKQMQQMVRDATVDMNAASKPPKVAQAGPAEKLSARADSDAPLPVPQDAEDVEFDGGRRQARIHQRVRASRQWPISIARP